MPRKRETIKHTKPADGDDGNAYDHLSPEKETATKLSSSSKPIAKTVIDWPLLFIPKNIHKLGTLQIARDLNKEEISEDVTEQDRYSASYF